jgi:hypothetical protein
MSEEYLTVTSDIPFGAVYAYRVGDRISRSAVEENDWHDYVTADKSADKPAGKAAPDATKKES